MATMYYYAYLNSEDIVEQIFDMPAPITSPQYISIPSHDETLIGKRYNRETGEFETVSWYYYAFLNEKDIVTEVTRNEKPLPVIPSNVIEIQSYDLTLIGKWYNRQTGQFTEPPIHVLADMSTDQINVGTQDKWLTDKLGEMDAVLGTTVAALDTKASIAALETKASISALDTKAPIDHTHQALSFVQNPVFLTSSNKLENTGFVSFKESYSPYGRDSKSQIFVPANAKKALVTLNFSTIRTTFCSYVITIKVNDAVVATVPVEGQIAEHAGGRVFNVNYAKMLDVKEGDEIRLHMNITSASQGDGAWFLEGGMMRADFF